MIKLELKFKYLSHRGVIEQRRILFNRIEWLPEPGFNYAPGWFIRGQDFDREMADRSFSFNNIIPEDQNAITVLLTVRNVEPMG